MQFPALPLEPRPQEARLRKRLGYFTRFSPVHPNCPTTHTGSPKLSHASTSRSLKVNATIRNFSRSCRVAYRSADEDRRSKTQECILRRVGYRARPRIVSLSYSKNRGACLDGRVIDCHSSAGNPGHRVLIKMTGFLLRVERSLPSCSDIVPISHSLSLSLVSFPLYRRERN